MCHHVDQIVFGTWVVAHAAGNRTGAVNGVGVPEQVLQTKVREGHAIVKKLRHLTYEINSNTNLILYNN